MLCSLWWSRDQHSLVSLFPTRPVVPSMRYLALKRLLSATRRILKWGWWKVRTVGTNCQAFATNSMSWDWRYGRPDGPVNVWWSISIISVGQCTRSDICHQGKKWLERYVLIRLSHTMLSTRHPLSCSFLPAKGLQACNFYKASLQEDRAQFEPRTWWSVTCRDWKHDSSKVVLRSRREWVRSLVVCSALQACKLSKQACRKMESWTRSPGGP
jgi:hypothetical protein